MAALKSSCPITGHSLHRPSLPNDPKHGILIIAPPVLSTTSPMEWQSQLSKQPSDYNKATTTGTDFQMAILDHRNTPSQGIELSPMQRLMNRRARTLLQVTSTLLQSCIAPQHTQKYYNRAAQDLPKLSKGDVMRIKPSRLGQREWRKGIVTSCHGDRSYLVVVINTLL